MKKILIRILIISNTGDILSLKEGKIPERV